MRKNGKNTLNSDKIECVKLAQREGTIKAMEKFKISPGTMATWQKQYAAGLYRGREHLSTIAYYKGAQKDPGDASIGCVQRGGHAIIEPASPVPFPFASDPVVEALKRENAQLRGALAKLLNLDSL